MHLPPPLSQDVVLIGGGHAHALFLRQWGMRPVTGARLTVIDPNPTAPYTGMLPGFVAGHYRRDDLDIDLVRLARFAGARLILGRASAIDRAARIVTVDGRKIGYDLASIDIGIHSDMPDLPGFAAHGTGAKPLGTYATRWADFVETARAGAQEPKIAVIGGGVAGAELALAMGHRLGGLGLSPGITIIEADAALSGIGNRARHRLLRALAELGIAVIDGAEVARIDAGGVDLADGRRIDAGFVLGAAGARPYGWLRDTGLADGSGFLPIRPSLQTHTDERIFAVGDCAHMPHAPRPKAGVFAVRQAPVLYHNITAALTDAPLRAYRPQKDFLKLISLGKKSALADRSGLAIGGRLLWHWKDRIDRAFMAKFHDYPEMPHPRPPEPLAAKTRAELAGAVPICGGCGAKVGGAVLRAGTGQVPQVLRADVVTGIGDDAAALQIGGMTQVISTDHLRAFCHDPALMARITAHHALGDIWAMGATPQAALASIILPPMTAEMQARSLGDIMEAAGAVMAEAGAAIVGGHTTTGAELTLGFTVTGITQRPIAKTTARAGDALILTKPLGSGTLLAAEMAGRAHGRDIAALYRALARGQGAASAILQQAHAMTDVTGFGLAGHLLEMLARDGGADGADPGIGAEIALDQVPFYAGAVDASASGIRPSLYAANAAAGAAMELPNDPRAPLLFDPETSGGLLAAVADGAALCTALIAAGYDAAVIGRVTDAAGRIRVV